MEHAHLCFVFGCLVVVRRCWTSGPPGPPGVRWFVWVGR